MAMKLLYTCLLSSLALSGFAQAVKPFKVNVAAGYAQPVNGTGNFVLSVEPSYALLKNLAIGLRIESATMAQTIRTESLAITTKTVATASAAGTITYRFTNRTVQPFVGLGAGVFALPPQLGLIDFTAQPLQTTGLITRVGFKVDHFTLQTEANLLPSTSVNSTFTGASYQRQNTYVTLKMGVDIGGGPARR